MTRCAIRLNTILPPFFSKLEFKPAGYIVLDELLGFIFAIVGGSFQADSVAEVLFNKEYRPPLLFLIAERGQPSGIDKRALLGKVITQVGENPALFIFHVTRNPEVLFEPYLLIPPYVFIVPHTVGAACYHLR